METYKIKKIKLDRRYENTIDQALRDKQHLWNNLVITWNTAVRTENTDLQKILRSAPKIMKMIKGKIVDHEESTRDLLKVGRDFAGRYASDILNTILREFATRVTTNLKMVKDKKLKSFEMKTKRLSAVKTGSISVENNNVSLNTPRSNLYGKEISITLFNKVYKQKLELKYNLKVYLDNEAMSLPDLRTVSLVKRFTDYYLYITYKDTYEIDKTERPYTLSIDPGSKNHLTLVSDHPKTPSIIVSNSIFKRIYREDYELADSYRRREEAHRLDEYYAQRLRRVDGEISKLTSLIRDWCLKYSIGTVVLGTGMGAKRNSRLDRRESRRYHVFPHYKFKLNLSHKLSQYDIQVIDQEESYTSSVCCLDREAEIWNYNLISKPPIEVLNQCDRSKGILKWFKTGYEIQADVNGAFNIMRKYKKEHFYPSHKQVFHPLKLKNENDFTHLLRQLVV